MKITMKPQQQLRKKNSTLRRIHAFAFLLFMGLSAATALPVAATEEFCSHAPEKRPNTLYEMVPHIVLPKTIQYKPMPIANSRPWEYAMHTDFPASYTAFPSYVLPFPAEMRSIEQAIYPIIPAKANDPIPLAGYYAPFPQQIPPFPLPLPSETKVHILPLASNGLGFRPMLIIAVPPVQDQEDQSQESDKNRTIPALPDAIQKLQSDEEEMNIQQVNHQQEQLEGEKNHRQVQWGNPMPLPPGPQQNPDSSCSTQGGLDPAKPLQPMPDPGQLAYTGYPQYGAYAQPYAQQTDPNADPQDNSNAIGASGLNQDILKRIEEMLQENPNIQFSAVMMGPNGQLIPLGNPNQGQFGAAQQSGAMQISPAQKAQQVQTQLQYVQAMNQYVQQLYAQQQERYNQFYGIAPRPQQQYPFAAAYPYGVNPYVNPYATGQPGAAAGPANAAGNDTCSNNSQPQATQQQMLQQQLPQQQMMQQQYAIPAYGMQAPLYNPYYAGMYGGGMYGAVPMGQVVPYAMVNPYFPMQQQTQASSGEQRSRGDRTRNLVERFREQRKTQERKLCEAWRSPHYAEDTGMKVPAKEAYPWGYFGSQVGPLPTPNYGGYHGLYYGNSKYPGN